jgi:outer membrane protein
MLRTSVFAIILSLSFPFCLSAQKSDSLPAAVTLQECVQFALKHQPTLQQTLLDEQIIEAQIKGRLADWYPQLNLAFNYQHNFQLPTSFFAGNKVNIGTRNTSLAGVSLSQNIFNRDVLLASRTATDVRTQARQNTVAGKIDIAVNVSKAFYDVLLSTEQVKVYDEDIVRLERSLRDAYNQYQGGIVDKIDYKRATISLNNARAEKRTNEEQIKGKLAFLKEQMGFPDSTQLTLVYDSATMEREIVVDTLSGVDYHQRIEFQLLESQQRLQQANVRYARMAYLPELSGFGSYNGNFLSNNFSQLYRAMYPQSFAGIQLSLPIFQGNKRIYAIREASLQLKRIDYDIQAVRNNINTQYEQALASYKSYLADYYALKENLALATEVYNTIQIQYKQGIKTYLEVVTAEADLRTSQVNYTNALYQVLISKLDVQRATGTIKY